VGIAEDLSRTVEGFEGDGKNRDAPTARARDRRSRSV
jgi:hypothetical protein